MLCKVQGNLEREKERKRALAEARGRGSRPRDRRATPARVQPGGSVNFLTFLYESVPHGGIHGIYSHRAAKLLLPLIFHTDFTDSIGRKISNFDFTTDQTQIIERSELTLQLCDVTFGLEFTRCFQKYDEICSFEGKLWLMKNVWTRIMLEFYTF